MLASQHLGISHCARLPLALGLLGQPSKGQRRAGCTERSGDGQCVPQVREEAELQEMQPVGRSGAAMGCFALAPWGARAPWPCFCRRCRASSEAARPPGPGRAGADPAAISLSGSAGGHPTPLSGGCRSPDTGGGTRRGLPCL